MLIKISPIKDKMKPISMIKEIRTWCYYSLADAKHLVEYAQIHGNAIVHFPKSKKEDFPLINSVCEQCGFTAEMLN